MTISWMGTRYDGWSQPGALLHPHSHPNQHIPKEPQQLPPPRSKGTSYEVARVKSPRFGPTTQVKHALKTATANNRKENRMNKTCPNTYIQPGLSQGASEEPQRLQM